MKFLILISLSLGISAHAQTPVLKPALTLDQYLEQVKTQNPEARSMREQVTKAELRLDEADVPLSSEFYGEYGLLNDKNEPPSPFQAKQTKASKWRVGVKDPTSFGLWTDVYVESSHIELFGISPNFPMMTDFEDSRAGIDFRQSLWRDGLGEATRAGIQARRAGSRIELLRRQLELKNLLLKAENAYWTLVSLNHIVRLQEENVGRAKKLFDWMRKRVGMRLVDDVDGLQARAAFEMRDLELQTSLDERSALARQFNMMRGVPNDTVEVLAELPSPQGILKGASDPNQRMTREDFQMVFAQAEAGQLEAKAAKSQIAPVLDLVGGVATNGLSQDRSASYDELRDLQNPTWQIGVKFSIPLDYSLIGNMRRSYKAAANAADALKAQASFIEERTWHDLLSQKSESQRRFERALALEKTQTELVKRERNRLLNGRTTTFQAITIEQNLAVAQIQRVRSQVGLIQIHNVLKNWEVSK